MTDELTTGAAVAPVRPPRGVVATLFRAIEFGLVAMLVGMLAMVLGNVVLRYAIGTGIYASEELSRTLFVWIVFVGAVVATRDGTHLGVDSLVEHLPHRGRVACAIVNEITIVGCCALVFWGTWRQHDVNATTRSLVTNMPLIWVFGVGYVLSLGIGLLSLEKLWRIVRGEVPDRELFGVAAVDEPAHDKPAENAL